MDEDRRGQTVGQATKKNYREKQPVIKEGGGYGGGTKVWEL